ncbi:fumarylacetoacetate hydrolase family protein [Dermatophilus congolensis]|uniref:fumarylacetoacetate hydrolase family protein n=1 Tax=Dermatophilus congolensis TaxID=1863 RepID=UPI001AAE7A79|nr:fumarylacetoacetate hydrolase family protein [Dermatophilus congolensis]MBO3142201.1 fumarylacetoacetate hydrolase family protein [Dermatophilus congolensis]MBO3151193.1 fumarylacetoacetate hydrolase family protein [Dermatophilus congolensis]MBO3161806.1 fumarylacetoacetate hydrolase family protein [Dermatophilus congolensis]MBO3162476.1 fumarylacetoacetate hydrolase family protein [Dermatophilus congolensis]MBO3176032.1 fumarylacetoacetate hydrolase family protein [Dermatophilus congolensi
MRIVRFVHEDEAPSYGVIQGDPGEEWIAAVAGDPLYTQVTGTGQRFELDQVRLVAPVLPRSKVIGVGRNYADHAAELGNEVPAQPGLFFIPNTAVAGPDDPVVIPPFVEEVSFEAELAVVIGTMCKDVPAARAMDVIFGYTCANDVTARDLQKTDLQWARAKGLDTFCPLGPWIETDLDPSALAVRSRVDGELAQDGATSDMVFDVAALIEYVSAAFTLLPGDVILTGTPAGVGSVRAGQRVEIEIEGIGAFSNPFVRRD